MSRVISGVTVSIASDALTFYDVLQPGVAGPQGDLIEDGVLVKLVRLTDLPAGLHEMTTFHRGEELPLVFGGIPFDVLLDAGAGETEVASDLFPGKNELVTVAFQFSANGSDDVVVRREANSSNNGPGPPWINGFTIVQVPEPASWLLLGSGAGALLATGWLRRRKQVPPAAS